MRACSVSARFVPLLLLVLSLYAQKTATQKITTSSEEAEVVKIINQARSNPAAFAKAYLTQRAKQDPDASECLKYMTGLQPMNPLKVAAVLQNSARDHANDMGQNAATGHIGTDGSDLRRRVERYGDWEGAISENVFYGSKDPLRIVLDLLVDSGVPARGHRRNILNPRMTSIGVSIRPHRTYGYNCVMDFAIVVR
jgi:uncharacterized protein YkwD